MDVLADSISTIAQPLYKVRLSKDDRSSVFEGPLDLLLFFIKRDELDIYDIPITRITREFLEYLRLMAALDLEIAGEFIVVAAELCQIKAKMLLPREERVDGVEEDDPRTDLVRRLLEYRRFKEMSEELLTMSEEQRKVYFRKYYARCRRTRGCSSGVVGKEKSIEECQHLPFDECVSPGHRASATHQADA